MNKARDRRGRAADDTSLSDAPKKEKYDYETMRAAATSEDPKVRKEAFIDYFERYQEFPSYVFDNNENEKVIDSRLLETIQDLLKDPTTPSALKKGIDSMMERLSS